MADGRNGEDPDPDDEQAPPICVCGVTALPAESMVGGDTFVCENPDCESFGSVVE